MESNEPATVTALGGVPVHDSALYGLVVKAHEHNRVVGDLQRENAKLREACRIALESLRDGDAQTADRILLSSMLSTPVKSKPSP